MQYKVICQEGSSVPYEIEASGTCTLCHRTDVDVKPVITEVKPDGVIHYYTRYFDNPAFSYWEFYDDGK